MILNLAEGLIKKSDKEFSRYLMISIGSLGEIVAVLDICYDLRYISSTKHKAYTLKCEMLLKKLYGFRRKINK